MVTTLIDIRTLVRQEADMVNSQFVSDEEMNAYINSGYDELYDLIVSKYEDYLTTSITFNIPSGQDFVDTSNLITVGDDPPVPVPIYKIRGLDKAINGPESWATIRRFNFANRNRFNNNLNSLSRGMYGTLAYDWVGNQIRIIPTDQASGDYQLWYIPTNTHMVEDSDAILPDLEKWVEYVVVDATIKCLDKEESDTQVKLIRKQGLAARIESMAANRDAANPAKIARVKRSGYGYDGERY